ncbi:MAG: MG2 domain-containing protein [Pseudoflavonifractor sp.]|nr:MG2 domain-containing protein [Pseudoflavonifractor sp.]
MRKLTVILLILLSAMTVNAKKNSNTPDFAYPKTVATNARKQLDAAVKRHDGTAIVRAAIDLSLAKAAVDNDNLPAVIGEISQLAAEERSPETRALLNSLLAKIYNQIYESDRWTYDKRSLPVNDFPGDYNEWSGEMFKIKIAELAKKSLDDREALQKAPLGNYKDIIVCDSRTYIFYPTLYDFIASQAIGHLSELMPAPASFSPTWLCPADEFVNLNFSYANSYAKDVLTIYQDLLKFHRDKAAPYIMNDIERIDFIANNVNANSHISSYTPDGTPIAVKDTPAERRRELFGELYDKQKDSEYSAEILIALCSSSPATQPDPRLYKMVEKSLVKYPDYFHNCELQGYINRASQKVVDISAQTTVVPGDSLAIKVTGRNLTRYQIGVFRVPYPHRMGQYNYSPRTGGVATKVATIERRCVGDVPYSLSDTVYLTLDNPGCYILVPALEDATPAIDPNRSYQRIHCTGLAIATGNYGRSRSGWIIDPLTGAPISDATMELIADRSDVTEKKEFVIGADGMVNLSGITFPRNTGWSIFASKGKDTFATAQHIYGYDNTDTLTRANIDLYTSLAIYHPGDTVEWSGVIYTTSGLGGERCHLYPAGQALTATLRDANYQEKGTADVVTDRWGRVQGSFPIPKDGLTGYFTIQLSERDSKRGADGSTRFMVSDYKLPTYYVEVTNIMRDFPSRGDVTVKGRAVTYSGFPLGGIAVDVNLGVSERRWWRDSGQSTAVYATDVTTDEAGQLEVTFPATLLAETPGRYKIFNARLTATSSTGESSETTARFSPGAPYIIEARIPQGADIDLTEPFNPGVRVVDLMDKPTDMPIRYLILKGDTPVADGHIKDNGEIDCQALPSGVYAVRFMLDSVALAAPLTVGNIAFYRPDDKLSTRDEPVWCPVTRYVTPDGKASILYGTTCGNINYTVWNESGILDQGWIRKSPGMSRFDVTLPADTDMAMVTLGAVSDYKSATETIEIRRQSSLKGITLTAESFRDKITPGAEETWTFRVTDHNGTGVEAAMMLDMYCKALDTLTPLKWQTTRYSGGGTRFDLSLPWLAGRTSISKYSTLQRIYDCEQILSPQFETWGRMFTPTEQLHNLELTSAVMVKDDAKDLGSVRVRGASMKKSAAQMAAADYETADYAGNMKVEAEATSDEESAAAAGMTDGANGDNQESFSYRPAEQALAFFRPMLSTDKDGRMTFSFTAPNANTTWRLCGLAFTDNVEMATISRDIISNKPVMVQPNMPRFLRAGDKAVIMASVMNNTDSVQTVTTDVEIFDPATGEVIGSSTRTGRIAPRKSETVTTTVDAPFDSPMLGYRIKSLTATFADGEQSVIAILPSSQPVIETTPFYITPDSTHYSMQLPKMPSDARVTLQFCENPAWYCVTALPGLRDGETRTSMSAAAAIFSAAVAEGILRDNPSIARAVHQWSVSDKSDSTLVSMLERNQDLKTVLLNATPWVMDARSDTERMERLSLLFNKKEIESSYAKAIKTLADLQRGNGGWAWIAESGEPSEWATLNILGNMGRLRQLGYLPDNKQLSSMITDAVLWLDKETAARYRKYPKDDYTGYVAVRDYFKDIKQSTAASRVTAATVQRVISGWKRYDNADKAVAALILNDNGYSATARLILTSLREYSVYTPTQGRHWPSLSASASSAVENVAGTSLILDAFNAVEPGCADVDQIRQWLILQKEAENWGNSVSTSDAIASILGSGTKWTTHANGVEISVNDRMIVPGQTDRMLGYFRTSISSLAPSDATLSVTKTPGGPAWGAVYCQYRGEMKDIAPQSCEAVSIEKRFYVQRGDKWEEADKFTVGDRVRVDLVIKATRDMDYVAITDNRGACFEPAEQLPKPIFSEGLYFYRENRDSATDMFVTHMPKGTYLLSYEMFANNSGQFSSGIALIQSQYAPALSAHSAGRIVTVNPK